MTKSRTFDASAAVADAVSRAALAKQLQKEHTGLVSQTRKIELKLEALLNGKPVSGRSATRQSAVKAKESGKKRGRPAKIKEASGKKRGRPAKATATSNAKRGGMPDGRSLAQVLREDILPDKGQDPVDREEISRALKIAGYKFGGEGNPMNSINQALAGIKKDGLALIVERGKYTLSTKGMKAKGETPEPVVEEVAGTAVVESEAG